MEGKEEGTVDQKRGETRTKRTAKKLKNKDKARRIEIVTLGGRAVLRRGTWRNQVKTERPREDDQSGHGKGNETGSDGGGRGQHEPQPFLWADITFHGVSQKGDCCRDRDAR